jgi:GNAT superfamily N-acetyltransferase
MSYAIRAARDADGAELAALISGCWAEYPGCDVPVEEDIPQIHALASDYAAKGGALWVAEAAGGVTGMVAIEPHGEAGEISKMYVSAAMRGTGLAQDLLALAENISCQTGAKRAILWSDTRFHRAHRFYEKQGYVRKGPIRVLHDLANSLEFRYEKPLTSLAVMELDAAAAATRSLADILIGCVGDGASLGFRAPLPVSKAITVFEALTHEMADGRARLFAGWLKGRLAGCAVLRWDGRETESHAAMLSNLMVAPWARRNGLAGLLINEMEKAARQDGRSVIYLFASDHGAAPLLYRRHGYVQSGAIPQGGGLPDGRLVDALIFHKLLINQDRLQ